MAKKAEEQQATGKAEPMTYERRRVIPVDRQVRAAMDTGAETVTLQEDTVKRITITNAEPAETGKRGVE